MIDSHQDMYSSFFHGDGFPAWSVHDDGIPLVTNNGFPLNYFTPAVEQTFTNLWADDGGVLDAYDQQLAFVARRFARDPMVLGYDLMNEPFSGNDQATCAPSPGCPAWDAATLSPAEASMARAVRSARATSSSSTSPRSSPTGARPTASPVTRPPRPTACRSTTSARPGPTTS